MAEPDRATRRAGKSARSGIPPGWPNRLLLFQKASSWMRRPRACALRTCFLLHRITAFW